MMANDFFQFKRFTVWQHDCAMKVCTDSCILGAYGADKAAHLLHPHATVLDVGGGTGLLSLMLAQKANVAITSIEIDVSAAMRMRENFKASPWSDRLTAIQGDVRTTKCVTYDFIISNPPFYENELRSPNEGKKLAHHDSGLRLAELADVLVTRLKPHGFFCIMIPFERTKYMQQLLKSDNLEIHETLTIRHSSRHRPFRTIIFGGTSPRDETVEKQLDIRDESEYSKDFKHLLRDYYLIF